MLIEQTLDKLHELKLTGMAHALGEQLQNPDARVPALRGSFGAAGGSGMGCAREPGHDPPAAGGPPQATRDH